MGRDDQTTIHLVGTANEADFLDPAAAKRPLAVLISSPTSPALSAPMSIAITVKIGWVVIRFKTRLRLTAVSR